MMLSEKLICSDCVREQWLSDQIERKGHKANCSYCEEKENYVLPIDEIAARVETVFNQNYVLTSSEPLDAHSGWLNDREYEEDLFCDWEREGDPVVDIIIEIMDGVEENIAEDIVKILDNKNHIDFRKDPDGEDPFSAEARYEVLTSDHNELESYWQFMKKNLHHHARYYNQELYKFMNELFADIHLWTGGRGNAIHIVKPNSSFGKNIYRARVAYADKDIKLILSELPKSLGAKTGRGVTSGRMNAAGISVFYGARDRLTCLAEVRAPVGSSVVVGRFELVRPVTLLNLEALERVYVKKSLFDPKYLDDCKKCAFLKTLSKHCSMPVMPGEEALDYVLTQAVCEYLANLNEPQLDGIIFRSSQRNGKGTNITLFNRSSLVEEVNYPKGTKKNVLFSNCFDDDGEYTIYVKKPHILNPEVTEDNPWKDEPYVDNLSGNNEGQLFPSDTLRLKEVRVVTIQGVSYSTQNFPVMVHEYTGSPDF